MRLNQPQWSNFGDLKELLAALEPAMVVGGAVRNALMGIPINDIDVATSHLPEEVMQKASKAGFSVIPTGIKHGTVTCVKNFAYEVTTLRIDRITDGRHAKVEFCNSWEEDAKRRDFTINALYADFNGQIYDFINGIDDIYTNRLRFIGNPDERIHEDYLRILRFFRFYAHYGKSYEASSLEACIRLASNLSKISHERCTYEFIRLLQAKNADIAIQLMPNDMLSAAGLPEKLEHTLKMLNQNFEQYELSWLGRVCCFGTNHSMVLSNQQRRLINQLLNLDPMYHQEDYVKWINNCAEPVLWDGIILRGRANNPQDIAKWMQYHFPIQGRDLIEAGMDPGPEIQEKLNYLMDIFAKQPEPMAKTELLDHLKDRQKNAL